MTKPLALPPHLSWATLCRTKNIERLSVHLPHNSAAVPTVHKLCLELTFLNNIAQSSNKSTPHSLFDSGGDNSACFYPSRTFFFLPKWPRLIKEEHGNASKCCTGPGAHWWKAVMKWCRFLAVRCSPAMAIPSHESYHHELDCVASKAATSITQELHTKEAMSFEPAATRVTAAPSTWVF